MNGLWKTGSSCYLHPTRDHAVVCGISSCNWCDPLNEGKPDLWLYALEGLVKRREYQVRARGNAPYACPPCASTTGSAPSSPPLTSAHSTVPKLSAAITPAPHLATDLDLSLGTTILGTPFGASSTTAS